MKFNFNMDLGKDSWSISHTPGMTSRQLPFYVEACGHFISGGGYYTERDGGMDNYLLFYTLRGSGELKYRGADHALGPNQAAVIDCNEYQLYRTGADGLWDFKYIHFKGTASKAYFDMLNGNTLNVVTLTDGSEAERLMDEIRRLLSGSDLHADIKLSLMLSHIMTELCINRTSPINSRNYSVHNQLVGEMIRFIQENHTRKIRLEDLADLTHMSKYHLVRLFKKFAGMGPYEYLINYRINRSKALLKDTGMNVGDISNRIGFSDVNNYIREFRKRVGTTPQKFRDYRIG